MQPSSALKYALHVSFNDGKNIQLFLFISRHKKDNSYSSDSFGPYIDVLKLELTTVSSFNISYLFFSTNYLFYEIARHDKPFENETQFFEAVDLHDKLYEYVLEARDLGPQGITPILDLPPALDSIFERYGPVFIPSADAKYAIFSNSILFSN